MRTAWIIANREYKRYFSTAAGYAAAITLFLGLGILFNSSVQSALQSQFGQSAPGAEIVLSPMIFLLVLFVSPAVTMHLISEEQSLGTLELLLTAPVKDWEFVVGKWLGGFFYLATLVLATLIFPFVLNQMVTPGIDQGILLTGYLGVLLVCSAVTAVGVAISSLFSNTVASFFVTFGTMLTMWIVTLFIPPGSTNLVLSYLDFRGHIYPTFLAGVIDIRDVVFYISVTAVFLFLGSVIVESRRWR